MAIPGIPTSAGGIASLAVATGASFFPTAVSSRSIGSIKANVTFEESHEDTLTVTDHPVEQGATISDHAFLNPVTVEIYIGFTPPGAFAAALNLLTTGGVPYLNQIYQNVLALQKNRVLNVIMTGKRLYTNMIIERISVQTDIDTENVLKLRLSCRQIIIVQTQATTIPSNSVMANPAKTGSVQNLGTKTLKAA